MDWQIKEWKDVKSMGEAERQREIEKEVDKKLKTSLHIENKKERKQQIKDNRKGLEREYKALKKKQTIEWTLDRQEQMVKLRKMMFRGY